MAQSTLTFRRAISTTVSLALATTGMTVAAVPAAAKDKAERHRGYGYGSGYGYYGPRSSRYGRYPYRYRHRDRVDAGDVIAGVLVLGTIAAIASSASKAKKDDRDRRTERRSDDRRWDDRRAEDRRDDGRYDDRAGVVRADGTGDAMARAVDACGWAAESDAGRDARVDAINGVRRDGPAWIVTGDVRTTGTERSVVRPFTCTFDDGRVRNVVFG